MPTNRDLTDVREQLEKTEGLSVLKRERMSRHTALRVGGPAEMYVTCETLPALRSCVDLLARESIPWVILGKCASVVVAEEGYRGCVLTLGSEFRRFSFDEGGLLHVGAGANLQRVVQESFGRGLSGLEFAVGLPGTVGGAVVTNASWDGRDFGSIVHEVVVFRPGEGMVRYAADELGWYRRCTDIPTGEIVLEVTLGLSAGSDAAVKRAMEHALAKRQACQPIGKVACDAIFADPPELPSRSASELIEACGLAGRTFENVQVYPKDPNYVVNLGGASADNVVGVMATMMSNVRQQHGIELRPQVKFLGY